MLVLERSYIYLHLLYTKPYRLIINGQIFYYYLVYPDLNYKLGHALAGISFDKDDNAFLVVSTSMDKTIREIIVKGFIYQLNLEENINFHDINMREKKSYLDTVKYEFNLAMENSGMCMISPTKYLLYRLSTLLHITEEMELNCQDITDLQLAIDFLTEELECFFCECEENVLFKN